MPIFVASRLSQRLVDKIRRTYTIEILAPSRRDALISDYGEIRHYLMDVSQNSSCLIHDMRNQEEINSLKYISWCRFYRMKEDVTCEFTGWDQEISEDEFFHEIDRVVDIRQYTARKNKEDTTYRVEMLEDLNMINSSTIDNDDKLE